MDQRLGLGVPQKEIEFGGRRSPVHGRHDHAGKLAGPMQGGGFPAILQRGHDVIAGRKSEGIEARYQGRDAAVPLRIGQAQLTIDDGKRVRIARNAAEKA